MSGKQTERTIMPIPDRQHIGLTTYDAKDQDTRFPPIEPLGPLVDVAEQKRLNDAREAQIPWKKWGPYLSERQWGTVREDYSDDGNAWHYFPFDHAAYRSYVWGEDGLAGISDIV